MSPTPEPLHRTNICGSCFLWYLAMTLQTDVCSFSPTLLTRHPWELKLLFSWNCARWSWMTWYKLEKKDHDTLHMGSLWACWILSAITTDIQTANQETSETAIIKCLTAGTIEQISTKTKSPQKVYPGPSWAKDHWMRKQTYVSPFFEQKGAWQRSFDYILIGLLNHFLLGSSVYFLVRCSFSKNPAKSV